MNHHQPSLKPDLNAARLHLRMLTGEENPSVAWQVFPDQDKARKGLARMSFGTLDEVRPKLTAAQAQGCGVFIAVNETDGEGRKNSNITAGRAVFLDLDGTPLPDTWPLAPALVNQSSHGDVDKYQCWWPIAPTEDFEAWKAFQKLLAEEYGGDPKCALLTQVGRCAGFWHQKDPKHPWQVKVVEDRTDEFDPVTAYSLDELAERFGFDLDAAIAAAPDRSLEKVTEPPHGWDNEADVGRATAFLANEGNWKRTNDGGVSVFTAACALRDMGISPELAVELLKEHVPVLPAEWPDDHIEDKVRHAYRYAQGDAGAKSAGNAAEQFAAEPVEDDSSRDVGGLSFALASEIEAKPVIPLWPGRIYRGKLSTWAGEPDQGKSVATCDIIARISRGGDWPDGSGAAPVGKAILLSAEDDPADTIVPRLMAAGADLDKVIILNSLVSGKGGKRMFSIAEDLKRLERLVKQHPDVVALFIDPVNAYMGTSKEVDSFRDTDVRAVLGPVKEWCEKHAIAGILVTHFKKGGVGRAIDRVMGSTAFIALSRSGWAFLEEKDGKGEPTGRKLMAKIKQNIAMAGDALAYRLVGTIVGDGISAPKIEWEETIKGSADELMNGQKRGSPKFNAAVVFLINRLTDGPALAKDIYREAADAGHAEKTLNRAKDHLGIVSYKPDGSTDWHWRMETETEEDDNGR